MTRYWEFRDYIDDKGVNQTKLWFDSLSKSARVYINNKLEYLEQIKELKRPYAAHMKKNCSSLLELRIFKDGVQFRPICCLGPADGQVTILAGATEKDSKLLPRDICKTAKERSIFILWEEPVNTKLTNRRNKIVNNLSDKEYRDLYVASNIANGLAFQIRAMRTKKDWKQKDLAIKTNTKQEAISRLENPDYGKFTLDTLKKLASAFDVALLVRFVPFSELVNRVTYMTPQDLEIPSYADDSGLRNYSDVSGVSMINAFSRDKNDTLSNNYTIDTSSTSGFPNRLFAEEN